MKKSLALILAFCLLAALSLSAFADGSYDSFVVGSWENYAMYNTSTGETKGAASGTSHLTVNADGTAAFYIGDTPYDVTWAFSSTIQSGYVYDFNLLFNGTSRPLNMVYVTDTGSPFAGQVIIVVGENFLLYQAA